MIRNYIVKIKRTGARFLVEEAVSFKAACGAIGMARATGSIGWDDYSQTPGDTEKRLASVHRIDENGNKVKPS